MTVVSSRSPSAREHCWWVHTSPNATNSPSRLATAMSSPSTLNDRISPGGMSSTLHTVTNPGTRFPLSAQRTRSTFPREQFLHGHSAHRSAARPKRRQVPTCLRPDQLPEGVGLAWHRPVLLRFLEHLDEYPARRAPLMELAGGMEVPRTEPQRRCDTETIEDPAPRRLKPIPGLGRGVDEGLDGQVSAGAHRLKKSVQVTRWFPIVRPGGQRVCGAVLRLLHIWLVEGVDPQDRSSHGHRELEQEEEPAQLRDALEGQGHRRRMIGGLTDGEEEAVVPVGLRLGLRIDGEEAGAVLPRRFRHKLLDPRTEWRKVVRQHQRELVATREGGLAHDSAQHRAGVLLDVHVPRTSLDRASPPDQKKLGIHSDECCGEEPENRESGVATSDVGRGSEHPAKAEA